MTLHTEVIDPPTAEAIELQTGPDARLLLKTFENNAGRRFITVGPQYRDRSGAWRLAASGLILSTDACRDLAPALLVMASTIDGAPEDPAPTEPLEQPCFEVLADKMVLESATHTAAENAPATIAAERIPAVAAGFKHLEELIDTAYRERNLKRLNRALGLREGMIRNAAAMAKAKHWPGEV